MKLSELNLFAAWFLIPQTLAMGWFSTAGGFLLRLAGVDEPEDGPASRLVGAALLLAGVLAARLWLGFLPIVGDPAGKGYRGGHQLLLGGNLLAGFVFLFPFFFNLLPGHTLMLLASVMAILFGCIAMALWAIGLSLVHQSTQPGQTKTA